MDKLVDVCLAIVAALWRGWRWLKLHNLKLARAYRRDWMDMQW